MTDTQPRCGQPRKDGQPCRTPVAVGGYTCAAHPVILDDPITVAGSKPDDKTRCGRSRGVRIEHKRTGNNE